MKLHEYQVKSLLSRAGVVCSEHVVVDSYSDLPAVLSRLGEGEKIVRLQMFGEQQEQRVDAQELEKCVRALLSSKTETQESERPLKVLVMAPKVAEKTYQLSVTTRRFRTVELLVSELGKKVYSETLFEGAFRSFQMNRLVAAVGLKARQAALLKKMVEGALQTFFRYDAVLLNLDSIALTDEGTFEAVDVCMECDDYALYRQPELCQIADRAYKEGRSPPCVLVDGGGSMACIGNGEALALATADFLKAQKGSPGRVIDVGSDCEVEHVISGMKMVGDARAMLLHLFTGLIDGETIAKRIVKEPFSIPVVAVFDGTNASGARRVLSENRSRILAAESLLEAIETVVRRGSM